MFSTKLNELLQSHEMTGKELAEKAGTSASLISNYLKGKRNPTVKSVERIAKVFGVTASYFIDTEEIHEADIDRVPSLSLAQAAHALGVPESFVKQGLRQNRFPWGYAVESENGKWVYFINKVKFENVECLSKET